MGCFLGFFRVRFGFVWLDFGSVWLDFGHCIVEFGATELQLACLMVQIECSVLEAVQRLSRMPKELAKRTKDEENGQKWRNKHAKMKPQAASRESTFSELNLVRGISPTPRYIDAIDVCWAINSKHPDASQLVLDVSQDLERRPWSMEVIPTLTKSSDVFAFAVGRTLAPEEHLRALGFDLSKLQLAGLSAGQICDLAGDSMSVGCVAVVQLAAIGALRGVCAASF
eukprot:5344227-Amphidinium_carterae.3